MKKQEYLKPIVKILPVGSDELLAGSVTADINGDTIGYGGIDDDGSLDPGAKAFDYDTWPSSVWEE